MSTEIYIKNVLKHVFIGAVIGIAIANGYLAHRWEEIARKSVGLTQQCIDQRNKMITDGEVEIKLKVVNYGKNSNK